MLEPKIDRSSPRERSPNALREHPKIDRKSGENRSKIGLRVNRAKTTRIFCSRTRLGVDFGRLGALPGAPGRPFWRPGAALATLRTLPRRAGDAPGRSRDTPETPSGRSRELQGVSRGFRDQFWFNSWCPGASPGSDSGLTFVNRPMPEGWMACFYRLDRPLLDRPMPDRPLLEISWSFLRGCSEDARHSDAVWPL